MPVTKSELGELMIAVDERINAAMHSVRELDDADMSEAARLAARTHIAHASGWLQGVIEGLGVNIPTSMRGTNDTGDQQHMSSVQGACNS